MIPPLKSGDSPKSDWQHINRQAQAAGHTAREASAARHLNEGGRNRALRTPLGGGGSSGNWNYRGLWLAAPGSPYMTYDVVQQGSGTSAGMYLSLIDNNGSAPDSGYGWAQVSSSAGAWL